MMAITISVAYSCYFSNEPITPVHCTVAMMIMIVIMIMMMITCSSRQWISLGHRRSSPKLHFLDHARGNLP